MPLTMVRLAKMIESARVRPRRMKRNPRVTMKEGSPVLTTSWPLTQPMRSAQARAASIAAQTGTPKKSGGIAAIIPVKPIIEPSERSNSPAIIRRQAPVATMPR